MLEIINPRPLQISHAGGSAEANIGIVVNWESARPLIKELEQTVNFAERKYGDLIQQLKLCKEYYQKWSMERSNSMTTLHKNKVKKMSCRKAGSSRSSSDTESLKPPTVSSVFNEKIRSKIFEITKEIKETNRKIMTKETCFSNCRKKSFEDLCENKGMNFNKDLQNHMTMSEPIITHPKQHEREQSIITTRTSSKILMKKRRPALVKRQILQKYKLRSKSLPQGVKRKFGFGSFVEVVDRQQLELQKVKSRGTVSSGSKSNLRGERGRSKSRSTDKLRIRERNRSANKRVPNESETSKTHIDTHNPLEESKSHTVHLSEVSTQHVRSCSNFGNDFALTQSKPSSTYLTEIMNGKLPKGDNLFVGKKSLALAPRQPIPFTICRTTKTFNLGLNIQQVLSLIKSKRHTAILQSIIKDNFHTARSAIQRTEPNINSLYMATSSRLAGTVDSETCPVREDTEKCCSIISSTSESGTKCKMLTCRQSMGERETVSICDVPSVPFQMEIQRPEDVWVVEQPDSHQRVQRYRSRCTCYPTRHSADYQKVLRKYLRINQCGHKTNFPPNSFSSLSFPSIAMTELCPIAFHSRLHYQNDGKAEFREIQKDLDNLNRWYERVQEHVIQQDLNDYELDAELNAFELELNYREEDWKTIVNYYKQVVALKRKVNDLRGRIRNLGDGSVLNGKPSRSRKDPFRPTPSMTLTRILRQIQHLQDKIKLIDSPFAA